MHQGAPQKNKSSLIGTLSKVRPKILTFTIQGITSAPSNVAQTHLLKDKICASPSYTRGTYHSAWSIRGAQRLSEPNQPALPLDRVGSCGILWILWDQKHTSFLLSFQCKWQPPGSLSFSHLPTPLETTNPSKNSGVPYLHPCTGVIMECGISQTIP